MGKLDGKVAFITGAARGQGRSHAVKLASEGASIIAIDLCEQIGTVPYTLASAEDLQETVRLVQEVGGSILARKADVRSFDSLKAVVDEGVAQFGRLDVVVANAGTLNGFGPAWEIEEQQFRDQWEVCAAGVWRTVKAAVPFLVEQGEGGAVVLTSSVSGVVAEMNIAHYVMAKFAVEGLMHSLAAELAPHMIRVNSLCPTSVDTTMVDNPCFAELFAGTAGASYEDAWPSMQGINALPVPFVEPIDVSNALLFLASDDARYVTGMSMLIDAGAVMPFKAAHHDPVIR